MPDIFGINQGARFIFSIVSFPFLSLFRLSVFLGGNQFSVRARFLLSVSIPLVLGKISRQDRLRATISDSVDSQHPWFCLSWVAFHFSEVRPGTGQSSVCSNVFTLWAT